MLFLNRNYTDIKVQTGWCCVFWVLGGGWVGVGGGCVGGGGGWGGWV